VLAKLGFLVVVIAFGGLMFVCGTLAPGGMRAPVAAFGRMVLDKLGPAADEAKGLPAGAAAVATQEPAPIPSELLQLPIAVPDKALYALQAGQFAVPEPAANLGKRLQAAGIAFRVFPVVDKNGQKWSVVAAGQYASPDEARTARTRLAEELGIADGLPVIRLPVQGS
jgi:hypothetical protein